jgi:hypothetical protein
MTKPSSGTTGDVSKMSTDPEEQKRAREQRQALGRRALGPILEELRAAGFPANSISDLVERYAPLSRPVVDVVLKWIPLQVLVNAQSALVRSLAAAGVPFDGRPLVDLFESTDSDMLRWAISNTLYEGRARNCTEWIEKAVTKSEYGDARQMLMTALGRLSSPEVAKPLLMSLYDEFPLHVPDGLARAGGLDALAFLRDKERSAKGPAKRYAKQAIKALERRAAKGK